LVIEVVKLLVKLLTKLYQTGPSFDAHTARAAEEVGRRRQTVGGVAAPPRREGEEWRTMDGSVRAIPEHFEPGPTRPATGPPTNLTGRAWAEILKPAKNFFGPSPARNAAFSCFTL
jgi:hypothetical protein